MGPGTGFLQAKRDLAPWEEARNVLKRRKINGVSLDPDYYLLEDDGTVGVYEPYVVQEKEAGELDPREAILVVADNGDVREISTHLPDRLGAIVGRRAAHLRWYCPKGCVAKIARILAGN